MLCDHDRLAVTVDVTDAVDNFESRILTLQERIVADLNDKNIDALILLNTLTFLPLKLRKEYEKAIKEMLPTLSHQQTTSKLFLHLNPLISFLDYELLKYIVEKFGSDSLKKDMRAYCSDMQDFMRCTTIKQLIESECFPGQPEVPLKFSLIEAKIGEDASMCTLEQLNSLRRKICSEVKLSEILFHLVALAESNSYIVRWLLPSVFLFDLIKSIGNIADDFFQMYKITSITVDGMWLNMSGTKIQRMWIYVGDPNLSHWFDTIHKQMVHELQTNLGERMAEIKLSEYFIYIEPSLPRLASIHLSEAIMRQTIRPSFIDFEMLDVIVDRFGSTCLKEVMKSCYIYMSVISKYTTIQHLIKMQVIPSEYSEKFIKAECRIMQDPSDYTLDDIKRLKNVICSETDLSKFALTVNHVKNPVNGSFTIDWLVPAFLASDVIMSAGQINREFYVKNSVASLSVGNGWLYNPVLIPFAYQLKERYQQSQGSPSPVGWIPSPTKKIFRLAMIQRERVQRGHIEDRFVRMSISGRVDDILHAKSPVELEHIFGNTLHGGEIILIEGAPGSGKSTLTVHICQRWGKGELFQEFTVVILVQLRDPAVRRAQTIAHLLPVENAAVAQELATALIATSGRGVLWVLDGWDELLLHIQQDSIFRKLLPPKPDEKKLKEIRKNPFCAEYFARDYGDKKLWEVYLQNNPQDNRLLLECSVIVASRPISSGDLHPVVSSRIEVLGFTPEEQKQYFTESLKGDIKALEALLEKIQENPVIQSICYLPLNAAFIVHTFKYKGQSLPNTEYEIYLSVILSCIQRHFEREDRGHDLPRELASFYDLSKSEAVREPFQSLCELAYHGVMVNKVTFSSSDLPQGSNTLSLLQAIESFLQSGKSVFYNFLHLSIQEVLSAYYIATRLSDSQQVTQFQRLFNQPRFTAVFQFYAAITKLKSPGIHQVIDRIVQGKFKPLLLSLLRCLHEAQDPSLCRYVAKQLDLDHNIAKMQYKKQYNTHVRLNIGDNSLSPLDCLSVSFFLSFAGMAVKVDFSECSIGDLGAKSLAKYLDSSVDHVGKAIIYLQVGNNDIHEEGASHIARTVDFIEHLYLSCNPIGDTGAYFISEAVRDTATIKTLIVNDCGITSRGAEYFSRALAQNSSLEKLDIGENNLGDEGISHVAEGLKQNKQH